METRTEPLISVVIPAYNAAHLIEDALQSVFAQTYQPREIIVVDDGSCDDTVAVVRRHVEFVKLVRQRNAGAASARNTGIEHATGDWIAFLDADDTWVPTKLERQAAFIASHPEVILVYSGFLMDDGKGLIREIPPFPPAKLWPALRYRSPILPSSVVVQKSALLRVGGFDAMLPQAEDWDLTFRLFRAHPAGSFGATTEALCCYRRWGGNQTNNQLVLLRAIEQVIETVTSDLHGPRKWLWRRQILGRAYSETAIELRERAQPGFLPLMMYSLLMWPFGGNVAPGIRRYKTLLHMLLFGSNALKASEALKP